MKNNQGKTKGHQLKTNKINKIGYMEKDDEDMERKSNIIYYANKKIYLRTRILLLFRIFLTVRR